MAPAVLAGDWLLAESWTYRHRAPRAGEVVIATDPRDRRRELIKRVYAQADGCFELRGDAAASSTDSRVFGSVPRSALRWRAVGRYWPPRRIGRICRGTAPSDA